MPGYEGEPFRPEMILWLELPDALIVGWKLLDPSSPEAAMADALRDTMKRPLAGVRRPTRIRLPADASVWICMLAGP
jgi:hypothetical protein